MVNYYSGTWWSAKDKVAEAVQNRYKVDPSGRVIDLGDGVPWKDHLRTMKTEVKFVLSRDHEYSEQWLVQSVSPKTVPLLEAGHGEEQFFVHKTGYIGGAPLRSDVLAMARNALFKPIAKDVLEIVNEFLNHSDQKKKAKGFDKAVKFVKEAQTTAKAIEHDDVMNDDSRFSDVVGALAKAYIARSIVRADEVQRITGSREFAHSSDTEVLRKANDLANKAKTTVKMFNDGSDGSSLENADKDLAMVEQALVVARIALAGAKACNVWKTELSESHMTSSEVLEEVHHYPPADYLESYQTRLARTEYLKKSSTILTKARGAQTNATSNSTRKKQISK